ncbi:unnamed protein product, partial [Mesorhabditis spiculigera]
SPGDDYFVKIAIDKEEIEKCFLAPIRKPDDTFVLTAAESKMERWARVAQQRMGEKKPEELQHYTPEEDDGLIYADEE